MRVEELEVKEGDPIPPAWIKLRAWVRSLQLTIFGAARVSYEPSQTTVVYEQESTAYIGHFHPRLVRSGNKQAVTLGVVAGDSLVNGSLVPVIDDVPMDGVLSATKTVDRPKLDLSLGPNDDFRSWVLLQAVIDPKTGKLDEKNPFDKPLTIIHRNDWDGMDPGVDDHGYGYEAIAQIVWKDTGTPQRIWPIVLHNIKHEYKPPLKAGQKGRHFFRGI